MGCSSSKSYASAPAVSTPPKQMRSNQMSKTVLQEGSDVSTVPSLEANSLKIEGDFANIDILSAPRQFFDGVLMGFIGKEIPDVAKFLQDTQNLQGQLEAAISDYKEWQRDKTDLELLGKVFQELAGAVEPLGHALSESETAASETFEFLSALIEMSNPFVFVYHIGQGILVNGKDISNHMESAAQNCLHANWEQMGEDIGHIMADFVGGSTGVMKAILKGILEGFVAKELPLVVKTRDDAKASYELLQASTLAFKQGKVEEAIQELAQAMTSLVAAVDDVNGAQAETKRLMKAIEQMKTPSSFVFHVNQELLLNGVDILQRMVSATKNFLSWHWEEFGKDVGSILADLVGSPLPPPSCWPFSSCSCPCAHH
jgi:hypothetical protein